MSEQQTSHSRFSHRYLSTASRFYNWYSHDVWTPGNPGHDDMRAVRRIHSLMRKKLEAMPNEELESKIKIENPWCPALDTARRDFQSTCPAPAPNQCPYTILSKYPNIRHKALNQGEMAATQFAFIALTVLSPKTFGLHDATDEDLEAYCHLWRGLGYLLGVDDDFNFCRGTLEDVKARSRDFIEFWVKPNFRDIRPEWEHVMRCMIEGIQYYFPGSTYETCLCDLAGVLNLHIPRFYSALSYASWIRHGFIRFEFKKTRLNSTISLLRFFFDHGSKFAPFRGYLNSQLVQSMERARRYDEKKLSELQEKSAKTLKAVAAEKDKCSAPMKECLE
ncbi:hypothetical protein TSAR_005260 [Trichomalopsis sarcophagae]|uniref:ER-bound oxygenase mpaB/mpaB'/Rubber oxygenase catalytic domain-containing protein n=1 Tax=Trichomalopsis sarcophagae TaxID=543379 RepID=A0A232FGV8_9HYME|nr:hypothetical protein TSAR_005260 [Trichomalopsis sarcophagae]